MDPFETYVSSEGLTVKFPSLWKSKSVNIPILLLKIIGNKIYLYNIFHFPDSGEQFVGLYDGS